MAGLQITEHPSPNFNERPAGTAIDTVVLHYTGMQTGAAALARLCDPAAEVSAHYLIEEDGRIFRLVPEEKRAWHAGVSVWQGRENLNHSSIGIELVNPGHEFGYRPFPEKQVESLLLLLAEVRSRHTIPAGRYLGHSDIAPARKTDPGELFPWARLAAHGFGLWSRLDGSDTRLVAGAEPMAEMTNRLNKQLAIVGYHIGDNDSYGAGTEPLLRAFQAHWRPETVSGLYDHGTAAILRDIATQSVQNGDTI
ncbi:MAG: N-acetylmuramoyl-L-alanine amidase [Alphaproteobacteria bacterium]|nr:MAG: N-acetylmuramoyl-L-alanine amidase [Alphaproteobacteria bacterium]